MATLTPKTPLEGWETREARWPKQRSHALFLEWFEVRCSEMVLDLGGYGD